MTPEELIADFYASIPEMHRREVLLGVRLFTRYLRDHWYEATLENHQRILDAMDAVRFFEQMVEALSARTIPGPASPTLRQQQMRWSKTCPHCGHVHEGDKECGACMGGGGICRCELEVRV